MDSDRLASYPWIIVLGWLDGSAGADLLKPAEEEKLREWLVSNWVNKTGAGDEDSTTTEPLAKAG